MNYDYLPEPFLIFGEEKDICPRRGIRNHCVYDTQLEARKSEILVGLVGTEEDNEKMISWLDSIKSFIPAKKNAKQPLLFQSFPGFNKEQAYCASLIYSSEIVRNISSHEIDLITRHENHEERVIKAVETYFNHCRYLSEIKNVDVIICVIPKEFEDSIITNKTDEDESEESVEDVEDPGLPIDFRRALKARCMSINTPIQLVREYTLRDTSKTQDKATTAWNLSIAIYYKALQTIPWKLDVDENRPQVCFVGISFYRSRDEKTVQTSLAQIFNENGKGVVLRGSPVDLDKEDRIPHLTFEQSFLLLKEALSRYRFATGMSPGRVVIHKSSKFYEDEVEGFEMALEELQILQHDFVTILETDLRFLRSGMYPPPRGAVFNLSKSSDRFIFYTKGSVHFYETYPGLYIPAPLDVRIVKRASSPNSILREILGLTKMNWNTTQFDNKYPITLACSRKVGEIMKYLSESESPRESYAFYM